MIVLSLRTGRYASFSGLAASVWSHVSAGGHVRALLSAGASALSDEMAVHAIALVRHFESAALIQQVDTARCGPNDGQRDALVGEPYALSADYVQAAARVPSVMSCCVWLALCRLMLRVLGLPRVLRLIRRIGRDRPEGRLDDVFLRRLLRNAKIARAICPIRTACLEQALLVWCVLRRAGAHARLRIGVHPYPFAAHAWAEHHGEAVVDSPDELLRFRPFPAIDPSRL